VDYYKAFDLLNETLAWFISHDRYKLTDQGFIIAQDCMGRAGLGPVNTSGQEATWEEEPRITPAQQEHDDAVSLGQQSPSSDEDIQEVRRSDVRLRNNHHFASSPNSRGPESLPASLRQEFGGSANPLTRQTVSPILI
jgi:hypothetical protein